MKFVFLRTNVNDIIRKMVSYGNTKRQAYRMIRDSRIIANSSSWGINSSWSVVKEGPVFVITIEGARHSLNDWCPQALLEAADEAYIRKDFESYDSLNNTVPPSYCGIEPATLEISEVKFRSPVKYRKRNKLRRQLQESLKDDSTILTATMLTRMFHWCEDGIREFSQKWLNGVSFISIRDLRKTVGQINETYQWKCYVLLLLEKSL